MSDEDRARCKANSWVLAGTEAKSRAQPDYIHMMNMNWQELREGSILVSAPVLQRQEEETTKHTSSEC